MRMTNDRPAADRPGQTAAASPGRAAAAAGDRLDGAAADVVLSMRGIGKSFPGVRALSGVELTVHAGEVAALLGENGAGKSTLMNVLAGVHADYDGEIEVDGR